MKRELITSVLFVLQGYHFTTGGYVNNYIGVWSGNSNIFFALEEMRKVIQVPTPNGI